MSEKSAISEEMRKTIGVEAEPEIFEVEKGHIRRFADAIGDPNPIYCDEAFAKKSKYGKIIAPPTFLQDMSMHTLAEKLMNMECPLPAILNGGTEVECYKPMMAGDVLTARSKVVDIYEKEGKSGRLLFVNFEVTFTNRNGELVARGKLNLFKR
jgi:acyl dehydratase